MITREKVHRSRYLSGRVQRWHTWPTLHKPNVAEHQCRVAQIYCEIFGLPRAEVLYYCIHHDVGEQYAGDVPFGAKTRVPGFRECINAAEEMGRQQQGVTLPQLTYTEWKKFKICDLLEMYEFSMCELNMGNRYASVPAADTRGLALKNAGAIDCMSAVENWINDVKEKLG
jgi:5'-deoxynucleotidase YfbR-like HD superfamily hydrolase